MLKLLLVAIVALSLAGTPAPEGSWAWVQVDAIGVAWTTATGSADVILDGERFEATLYDLNGAKISVLKGRAKGDEITGVDPYSPTSGQNVRGLGPSFAGRRLETFPQTSAVPGAPPPQPKRLWESIVLTRMDSFIGFTRK
jgi:hypothetical protein